MSLINKIKIQFACDKIGIDEFGNSYWEEKSSKLNNHKKKRYILYNGICEPSKIPAEWHSWIHYTSDVVPINIDTHKYSWQKIHLPNMTGTQHAYHPNNKLSGTQNRKKVSSDYQSWNPQ